MSRCIPILVFALLAGILPAMSTAQEYAIGAGDIVKVTVWGQDDLSREYPVTPDGYLPFPLLGRVKAEGSTAQELGERLRVALEKDFLVNPQVIVAVKEYLSQKVQILGEAEKPGLYYLTGPTTLVELISKAGVGKTAGKEVLVVRSGADAASASTILRFDIGKMQAGDSKENVTV